MSEGRNSIPDRVTGSLRRLKDEEFGENESWSVEIWVGGRGNRVKFFGPDASEQAHSFAGLAPPARTRAMEEA